MNMEEWWNGKRSDMFGGIVITEFREYILPQKAEYARKVGSGEHKKCDVTALLSTAWGSRESARNVLLSRY
jgi:hypothetical protein